MKVRALKAGTYDNAFREVGEVFDIDPAFFSEDWMSKVEEKPQPEPPQEEAQS